MAEASPVDRPPRVVVGTARAGTSVRVRITAVVALLVAVTLVSAGVLVYLIEIQRLEAQTAQEVDQEIDEFAQLEARGIDPTTRRAFTDVQSLLETFMERNIPDDDEVLAGYFEGQTVAVIPATSTLVFEPAFEAAAERLVERGGSVEIETDEGTALLTAQPLRQGQQRGAFIVASFPDEDRGEVLDTIQTYAVVGTTSLAVICVVAFWQAGRLLRPLRTLRDTAEDITATDLSLRLPVDGNDDITALTRTVNGMLDRLESAFVGQRQFLDDAGHELKTPLTVLRGHLELLETGDPDDVEETRVLLLDEVDRMARLVNDLILLAKTNRPDFLDLRPVDVAALTETVLAKARVLGRRTWVLDEVADGQAAVDEQRLTQALLQLADNAVKHTGEDDEIALGSARDASGVTVWVRDTGPGVPLSDRERIFERFGRSVVASGDEGFGLGLSIVTAIARGHGGFLELDHSYVDGARFVLHLPTQATAQTPTHVLPPSEES